MSPQYLSLFNKNLQKRINNVVSGRWCRALQQVSNNVYILRDFHLNITRFIFVHDKSIEWHILWRHIWRTSVDNTAVCIDNNFTSITTSSQKLIFFLENQEAEDAWNTAFDRNSLVNHIAFVSHWTEKVRCGWFEMQYMITLTITVKISNLSTLFDTE